MYTDLPKYGRSFFSPIHNTFKIAELVGIDRLCPQLYVYNNRPFAKKNFIFFLESTIKNKFKSKISEF